MSRTPFTMELPQDLRDLVALFRVTGHKLYVVGGAVRDAVLGLTPTDFDVATDATPDRVMTVLNPMSGWLTNETGKSFGVIRARRPGGQEYEIATLRRDIGEGRRPEAVVFTSIEDDVRRRDLTINALFYDVATEEIVDLVDGLPDLQMGVIRTVGDPNDRFREDGLRVLRTLRFAARFGFSIEGPTARAIRAHSHLNGVSPERIRDEFVRGIAGSKTVRGFLQAFDRFGMWPSVFPGLDVLGPWPETRSVPIVLSIVLGPIANGDQITRAKTLLGLRYTAREVTQALFYDAFSRLAPHNAFRLKKTQQALHITNVDLLGYVDCRRIPAPDLVSAFTSYQIETSGADLLAEGFLDRQLGDELERRETVRFERLLSDTQ